MKDLWINGLVVLCLVTAVYLIIDHGEVIEEIRTTIENDKYYYKVYYKVVRYEKEEVETDSRTHQERIEQNWDGRHRGREFSIWNWLNRKQF